MNRRVRAKINIFVLAVIFLMFTVLYFLPVRDDRSAITMWIFFLGVNIIFAMMIWADR